MTSKKVGRDKWQRIVMERSKYVKGQSNERFDGSVKKTLIRLDKPEGSPITMEKHRKATEAKIKTSRKTTQLYLSIHR